MVLVDGVQLLADARDVPGLDAALFNVHIGARLYAYGYFTHNRLSDYSHVSGHCSVTPMQVDGKYNEI